jgi:ribonuclease BN (tRNA processing enzyme)
VKYGGNTTCYAIESESGDLLVIDAGSGIRPLGLEIMKQGPRSGTLLITHTHYDHIIGFPFFVPLYVPGFEWRIAGPPHYARDFGQVIDNAMSYEYFPIRRDELGADLEFETWKPGEYEVGAFKVTTRLMNHPVTCLGYRVEVDGVSMVFTGDHEPYYDPIWGGREPDDPDDAEEKAELEAFAEAQNQSVRDFFAGADLLIYDATYTAAEYAHKRGWGHAWIEYAIDDAISAGVKELWLSHHEPTRSDAQLDELAEQFPQLVGDADLKVSFAREGESWTGLRARRSQTAASVGAQAP